MAGGEIPLSEDMNPSRLVLKAQTEAASTSVAVMVQHYELPPFFVRIEPLSKLPLKAGHTFKGRVTAVYPYGEPVAGKLKIRSRSSSGKSKTEHELNEFGQADFTLPVGVFEQELDLNAEVKDGSGRRGAAKATYRLRGDELRVLAIPDGGHLVPDKKQWMTILTTDGNGNFENATLYIRESGRVQRKRLRTRGAVRVQVTPKKVDHYFFVRVSAIGRGGRVDVHKYERWVSSEHEVLRVVDPVLTAGQPVEIEGVFQKPKGFLMATLLRDNVPISSQIIQVGPDSQFRASLPTPKNFFGLTTVRISEIGWKTKMGNRYDWRKPGSLLTRNAFASVYLLPPELDLHIDGLGRYRPGETAHLDVTVRDEAGNPVPGASLAASVVDERVARLGHQPKDLIEVLRGLNVGTAEEAGLQFLELLGRKDKRRQLAAEAIIRRLYPRQQNPEIHLPGAKRLESEYIRLDSAYDRVFDVLVRTAKPLGVRRGDGWTWNAADVPFDGVLRAAKWKRKKGQGFSTPWGRATTWRYAVVVDGKYEFDENALAIASDR
jgi:hypothetical protein